MWLSDCMVAGGLPPLHPNTILSTAPSRRSGRWSHILPRHPSPHAVTRNLTTHCVLLHCAAVSPPPQCALSISYDLRAHLGPQVRSPMSLRAGCASSTSTPLHTLQPTPPAPCASSHDARSKPISRSAAPRPTPDPTPPSPRPPRRAVPAARQRRPPPL